MLGKRWAEVANHYNDAERKWLGEATVVRVINNFKHVQSNGTYHTCNALAHPIVVKR